MGRPTRVAVVFNPASGGGDPQHALGLAVQLRDPLEQQIPQDVRQVHAILVGGGQ